jgi:hypothetical protein
MVAVVVNTARCLLRRQLHHSTRGHPSIAAIRSTSFLSGEISNLDHTWSRVTPCTLLAGGRRQSPSDVLRSEYVPLVSAVCSCCDNVARTICVYTHRAPRHRVPTRRVT